MKLRFILNWDIFKQLDMIGLFYDWHLLELVRSYSVNIYYEEFIQRINVKEPLTECAIVL